MLSSIPETRTLPVRTGWTSSFILAAFLRISQFIFSVITLGLLAYLDDVLTFRNPALLHLGLATSVISAAYLIGIAVGTLKAAPNFMAGPVLICEIILLCLWIASFVVIAILSARCDRWDYTVSWRGGFWIFTFGKQCEVARASIAMAGVTMLLYFFTFTLFLHNAVLPISKSLGGTYLWRPATSMNATYDRGTGLLLFSTAAWAADPEYGAAIIAQASSSSSSNTGNEKITDPSAANRPLFEPQAQDIQPTVGDAFVDPPAPSHIH